MASSTGNQSQPGPSPANGNRRSEVEIYNSEKQPIPPSNPGNQPQPTPENAPQPKLPLGEEPTPGPSSSVQHRFLSPTEWARVAHGLGAIREGEEHQVVHPRCWYWPPKGLPEGLYRDVVTQRTKYSIGFQLLNTLHWSLMTLQVMVGAVLTALGSLSTRQTTPITALAAVNTVGAGLLGLMHNSGLPDRYRMDKAQFVQVEDFIREVLDTGIVEAQQKAEDILNECYARFQTARATVLSNKPEVYNSSPTAGNISAMVCPEPSVHVHPERK